MLQGLVPLINEKACLPEPAIRTLSSRLNLSATDLTAKVRVASDDWTRLVMLSTYASKARSDPVPLEAALSSDLLLNYDPATGTFIQTTEYDLLAKIIEQARLLERSAVGDMGALLQHGQRIDQTEARSVPKPVLAQQLHGLFRWADLVASAKALALALQGEPLVLPTPMPRTPFLDQEAGVAKEEVSLAQIREFVGQ